MTVKRMDEQLDAEFILRMRWNVLVSLRRHNTVRTFH